MRRTSIALRHSLPLLALAALGAASYFGPPRITVSEVSGSPPTPGAVLVVNAVHHTDEGKPDLSARAEGIRSGQRVSRPIALTATDVRSRFGVAKQWETGTPWVLVFTIRQGDHGEHGVAEALVKVDASGKIVGIEHAMDRNLRGDVYPRALRAGEVDAALASLTGSR